MSKSKNATSTSFPERSSNKGAGDNKIFLEADDNLFRKTLLLDDDTLRKVGYEGPSIDAEALEKDGDMEHIFTPSQARDAKQCKFIIPEMGKCFKTKDKISNQKVFVNICHSSKVPEPPIYFSDTQLRNLLHNEDDDALDDIRIPMSIGAKRVDKDKAGVECQAYDIIINTDFYNQKILTSDLYWTFLCVVSMEALDEKHKVQLEKNDYVVMKYKACHGKPEPQFVRDKPNIREVSSSTTASTTASSSQLPPAPGRKPLIQEITPTNPLNKDTPAAKQQRPKIDNESPLSKKPPSGPVVREVSTKVFKKPEDPTAALPSLDMTLDRDGDTSATAVVKLPGMRRCDYSSVIVNCLGDTLEVISVVGKSKMKAPVNIVSCKPEFDYAKNTVTLKLKLAPMTEQMIQNWKDHGHNLPEFSSTR